MMTSTLIHSIIAMIMAEHTRMEDLHLLQAGVSVEKKGRTKVSAQKKGRTKAVAAETTGCDSSCLTRILPDVGWLQDVPIG